MAYRLQIQHQDCTGCMSCSLACRNLHPESGGAFRRIEETSATGQDIPGRYRNVGCLHCGDPRCMAACPHEAIAKNRSTGVVYLSWERCTGCGACATACPVGAVMVDAHKAKAYKCDLCAERLEEGKAPACVCACPLRLISLAK